MNDLEGTTLVQDGKPLEQKDKNRTAEGHGLGVARVFPRRTKANPTDPLAFFGPPPMICPPQVNEVHVSVAFTWDLPKAEWLAKQWEQVAPVKIGGPGTGMRGNGFQPGMYLKPGHVITSRGCPNRCWFCSVWRRDGEVRELTITEGWDVLDDNLLACSEQHIRDVFAMLARQSHPIRLSGGLEAKRLQSWHVELMAGIRLHSAFFAYDTPDDFPPLIDAARILDKANVLPINRHGRRCYVLVGYPNDTISQALIRIKKVAEIGYFPMAMLWRDADGKKDSRWLGFQKRWANPYRIGAQLHDPRR